MGKKNKKNKKVQITVSYEMNKEEALRYLVKNERHGDEWEGVGMYLICKNIILSNRDIFTNTELDLMIEKIV